MINDWTLSVATANGTGSQTANNTLVKCLFRMGIPVAGKNLFPSNIQGLPTWFSIRVHPKGYVGRKEFANIFVAFNKATAVEDLSKIQAGGCLILDEEITLDEAQTKDFQVFSVPAKNLAKKATSSIKLQKLLKNMIYVGVLAELLELDADVLEQSLRDQFPNKKEIVDVNLKALELGQNYAREQFNHENFPYKSQKIQNNNADKILIDGNTAAAMGLVDGGCQFLAWYPITPASSLAENLQAYSHSLRNKPNLAVVQAEDELSAINMVIGAGWAGARALTSTSGPGMSLMSEAAGLSYFAEIPTVLWNVQRAGPSTGLPTRTLQGDLTSAVNLSHGDTEHIVLIPGNPEECFEFGQTCFDLAERVQTLIIVLTDLDLGMNFWISKPFQSVKQSYQRGKVLDAEALLKQDEFARYKDTDGDSIPYRTLPGTKHINAAYFTRGTGHDDKANYSENPKIFEATLSRLKKKIKSARQWTPKPIVDIDVTAKIGMITYGSTSLIADELSDRLGHTTSHLRVRSLPLHDEVEEFVKNHAKVFVIEQNRDAQLMQIIRTSFPKTDTRHCESILSYDGLPISPQRTVEDMQKWI